MISILSITVELLEMSCAESADALAPWAGNKKSEDLLSPLHLMCIFCKHCSRPSKNCSYQQDSSSGTPPLYLH